MQEIITGLRVQCLAIWAKLACAIKGIFKLLFMHHLIFRLNVSLAQLIRHWSLKLVKISCIRSSPTGGNFFAVVKSFEYNNAISANFVQTVKNSSEYIIVHSQKFHVLWITSINLLSGLSKNSDTSAVQQNHMLVHPYPPPDGSRPLLRGILDPSLQHKVKNRLTMTINISSFSIDKRLNTHIFITELWNVS